MAYSVRFLTKDTLLRYLILLSGVLLFSSCANLKPVDFAKGGARLELDHFFRGPAHSWGVYENASGDPQSYFSCREYGTPVSPGDLVIHQLFTYSNGKKQVRDWHLHRMDNTHWEASCQDIIGLAKGEAVGNALYWEYDFKINPNNPLSTVHIRQWFYQTGPNVVMVRLFVSKFGIRIGQVSESIIKGR